jgi:hypothetical protein
MKPLRFGVLAAFGLLLLAGCDRPSVSEAEMEELMKKHRPGYAEMQKRQQGEKAGAPAGQAPVRP